MLHHRMLRLAWVPCLALSLVGLSAQTTNQLRPITLEECIGMALRENLDLQIERLNPAISLSSVEIARAGYDPVFRASGQHTYSVSGGGLLANNVPYQGSTTENDTFSAGIRGQGPFGLGYDINGSTSDRYGVLPSDDGTNVFLSRFGRANGSIGIDLTQPLLRNFLIDDTRYQIAIQRSQLKSSSLQLQQQIISVVTSVERAYYELIYARENLKVQEEGLRLAQQLLSDNRKRVQVGILSPLDEKQSESEAYARQADVSSARRTFSTAQNTLKRLITQNYRQLHELSLSPTETLTAVPQKFDLIESWTAGLSKRPDILEARTTLERQGITLKYLKNQRLPALDLNGSYGYTADGPLTREFHDTFRDFQSQDKPFWGIGASVAVPLSNKAARERVRQGRLTSDQLILTLKNQEEGVMAEIDEIINGLRTNLDRVTSTRQARIYAEQALDAGQKRLQAGTSTSFEVLQLQRDVINARTVEIRAIADYNQSVADLYRAEGTTLERKKIAVDVK